MQLTERQKTRQKYTHPIGWEIFIVHPAETVRRSYSQRERERERELKSVKYTELRWRTIRIMSGLLRCTTDWSCLAALMQHCAECITCVCGFLYLSMHRINKSCLVRQLLNVSITLLTGVRMCVCVWFSWIYILVVVSKYRSDVSQRLVRPFQWLLYLLELKLELTVGYILELTVHITTTTTTTTATGVN